MHKHSETKNYLLFYYLCVITIIYMKKLFCLIFIIGALVSTMVAQWNFTATSDQKKKFMPDNFWDALPKMHTGHSIPAEEIPLQAYINKNISKNINQKHFDAEKKDLEIIELQKLLKEVLNIKIDQLTDVKVNENKSKQVVKAKKQKIAVANRYYKISSQNVTGLKNLNSINASETVSYHHVTLHPTLPMMHKKVNLENQCIYVINKTEGKTRYVEIQSDNLFNFTPQKLKSHFKDKELMQTNVAVIAENKVKRLRATQILITKEAANNYGYIAFDGLLRITLITGKKIDLYASESSTREIEQNTGNVIYKTDFILGEDAINGLSNAPIDTIGIRWTSGFESYTIYNVDVIMNQLACLHKVLK